MNVCKAELHKSICDNLNDTYKRKNHDYGDSFAVVRRKMPNAILVRLFDKVLRLETLLNGGEQRVSDENIDDTLLDLANYALMELVERQADKDKSEANETVQNDLTVAESYFGKTALDEQFKAFCKMCESPTADESEMGNPITETKPIKIINYAKYSWLSTSELSGIVCDRSEDCKDCMLADKCTDREYTEADRQAMIEFLEQSEPYGLENSQND